LGVSSAQRNPTLPDMPTIAETGLPGFDVNEWNMLVAPAATPAAVIAKLHQEVVKSLNSAEAKVRIAALGATSVGNTPTQAAQRACALGQGGKRSRHQAGGLRNPPLALRNHQG